MSGAILFQETSLQPHGSQPTRAHHHQSAAHRRWRDICFIEHVRSTARRWPFVSIRLLHDPTVGSNYFRSQKFPSVSKGPAGIGSQKGGQKVLLRRRMTEYPADPLLTPLLTFAARKVSANFLLFDVKKAQPWDVLISSRSASSVNTRRRTSDEGP